jgi:tetratricopeptide (TPR) repeat protein
LQLIQGQALNALHTVDRGLNLIKTAHLSPLPELWRLKAYAFVGLHQQDQAVALLRAALRTSPDFSPNRLLFAKLLLSRGDVSEAAAQADVLEQQLGAQDPRVATLRLAVLNADVTAPSDDNRTRQIRELYGRLPEADRHQMALKARQALACGDTDDAIRLLQTICAADPTSATAAIDLSQVLAEHNHSDRAKAVIARALQAHPDDANLLMQKRSLEGASQADLKQFAQKLSEKNSDAFVRVLRAAQAALAKRDTAAAKVLLDAAEKLKPEDLTLVNLRFQWNLQERHWDAADECAQKLAKANFDQMGGLSYRFQIVVTRGDDTAATAIAREMTTSYGDFAGSWLALGQTLQGTSQYSKAIAAYQRAVAMQHDMLPAITGIASCLLSIGANGDALDWIRQATAIAPADAEVRDLQLRQQLTGGDPRALLPAREAAVRDEPDRWDNAVALARVYRRINVVEATSNPQASRDALQRALAILKQAVRQWPDVPTCYVWAASTMAQSGDVEGGVQILRDLAARAKWAHRPEPWLLLADYQQNYGSPAAAELALREAIKLGSSNVGTALKLSQEILEQGRAEQALAVLAPYIADLRVQQRRIEILLGMDRAAQAEAEVKLALKAVPDSPQLMTLMGMVYESRKDDAQATKWLDRAIAADNGILAHRVRGALRLRQPSVSIDKAIEDLQMAYQADPGDPESAMLLASAYARKQDGVQARAILQRSLALTPSDKRIRLSLVTLDKTESPPPWDKISKLIDQGRSLAAWDPDWLAEEARMWASRGQPAKGAAFMKQAVQLALRSQAVAAATQPASADALQTTTRQAADFVREQLLMLINSKDDAALLREADEIIARFGTADLASAWAYLGRAIVHHNPKFPASQLESDYDAAIAAAKAAGNATDCLNVVSVIADGGGPDAALRRISGLGAGKPHSETGAALVIASDPRWDVLRIELLDRKGDIPAAVAAADATLPRLSKFSSDYQILLLRASAEAYSRLEPTPQVGKARDAYLSLIQRAPEDRFALNNLAWLYLEQTKPAQPAQALIFSQRAYNATYRYGEFDPHVGDTHGWVLACNGRTDEAIQILTLVVRVLPEPGTYDHLAETYLIAGQPKAALANIELAIQLGARSQQARQPLDSALAGRIGKTFARVAVWSIFSGETPTPAQISNIAP